VSKPFWVSDPRANGGGFFVETLEIPSVEKRARKKAEQFVLIPLQWASDMAKATRTPGATVWILLRYMAWKTNSQTFPLSNVLLERYGIARETKRRVLAKLAAAGQIKIQHRHKQAPIITLLR
jgi:hypothetical protein